jgi:hypothetical protein
VLASVSTTSLTEIPALKPVVCVKEVFCVTGAFCVMDVFCWEDVAAEGEVEVVAVPEEFVSALELHSPHKGWHPTPQYDAAVSVRRVTVAPSKSSTNQARGSAT